MIRVTNPDETDEPMTVFDGVALDDVTMARLMEVCEGAKAPPAAIIAAIVRDVLADDAEAHAGEPETVRPDANKDLH